MSKLPEPDSLIEEQIDFYRAEADAYDAWLSVTADGTGARAHDFREGRTRVAAMLDRLQIGGRVLEIATGTGSFTLLGAPRADRLTALDSSPEALALAQRRLAAYGDRIDYVLADVFGWEPPRAHYDVVCFAAWLHHVPPSRFDRFWTVVDWALAPGGQVVFEFGDRAFQPTGDDYHELPEIPGQNYCAYHVADQGVSVRDLNGQRWHVVHTLWDRDELLRRLAALGWEATAETRGWDDGSVWVSAGRRC
jgi:SAM-dependent methyltransferase